MARSEGRSKEASQIENRRQSERIRVVIIRVLLLKVPLLSFFGTFRYLHPLSLSLSITCGFYALSGFSGTRGNISSVRSSRKYTQTHTLRVLFENAEKKPRRLQVDVIDVVDVAVAEGREKEKEAASTRATLDTLFSPRVIPLTAERGVDS